MNQCHINVVSTSYWRGNDHLNFTDMTSIQHWEDLIRIQCRCDVDSIRIQHRNDKDSMSKRQYCHYVESLLKWWWCQYRIDIVTTSNPYWILFVHQYWIDVILAKLRYYHVDTTSIWHRYNIITIRIRHCNDIDKISIRYV